jgi:O-antigen ligase/tetratricopeptide (TPR) repeat protein
MATAEPRPLGPAVGLLAALLLTLPWLGGGRAPAGHAALGLGLALAAALALLPTRREPPPTGAPWLLPAACLLALSAAGSLYPDRTVESLLLLAACGLAAGLSRRAAARSAWAEPALLAALAASGLAVAIGGAVPLWLGRQSGLYATLLTGPFGYPNAVAGYLLLAGGAALALAAGAGGVWLRRLGLAAALALGAGLLLTRSRGALAAVAVAAVAVALVKARLSKPRQLLAGLIVAAGCAALLWWSPAGAWLLQRFDPDDPSFQWRWRILELSWAMIRDHPWAGVGPGAFPPAVNLYQRLPYVGGQNPHNAYIEWAAEFGLPLALLASLALTRHLLWMARQVRRARAGSPEGRRTLALLAALVAFALHSAVELNWSFPACLLGLATLLGLTGAGRPGRPALSGGRMRPGATVAGGLLLLAAALVLCRYASSQLVTHGLDRLDRGQVVQARTALDWAVRLNPVSFPARQWQARIALHGGEGAAALESVETLVRWNASDPNTHALAGEVAAALARWETAERSFRRAVELAPAAQLRFYAGLVDALRLGNRATEAGVWAERAAAVFTPARVGEPEARCLAPGDRYLLARLSRTAAQVSRDAGDERAAVVAQGRARDLARPDLRGICADGETPGQRSPEAAVASYWRALAEGDDAAARRLLIPALHGLPAVLTAGGTPLPPPRTASVPWILSLEGGERQVSLHYVVALAWPDGTQESRCAHTLLRLEPGGWIILRPTRLEPGSCRLPE